jgi:hypothetical protein
MKLGWIAVLATLSLPSGALAEDMCGLGRAASGDAEISVSLKQIGAETPQATYVHVDVATPDKAFKVTVHYDPVDEVLGPPTSLTFTAYMPLPDPSKAAYEHIAWSFDDGPWSVSQYGDTPQRRSSDPAVIEGYASHQIARRPPMPISPKLLTVLPSGVRIALKRQDTKGHELGSGTLDYPPETTTGALFLAARRAAVADLKPCRPGVIISAAPPRL